MRIICNGSNRIGRASEAAWKDLTNEKASKKIRCLILMLMLGVCLMSWVNSRGKFASPSPASASTISIEIVENRNRRASDLILTIVILQVIRVRPGKITEYLIKNVIIVSTLQRRGEGTKK